MTRTLAPCLWITGLVFAIPQAHADTPSMVEYTIQDEYGSMEVNLQHGVTTIIYLDSKIRDVINSDRKRFLAKRLEDPNFDETKGRTIVIRPAPNVPSNTYASLLIATEDYRLGIRMHVVEDGREAHVQAVVRRATSGINLATAIPSCNARQRSSNYSDRLTADLLDRSGVKTMGRIGRSQDNIAVRVEHLQWLGRDEAFLLFSIDNKSRTKFDLADVSLTAKDSKLNLAGSARLQTNTMRAMGVIGVVPPGQQSRAIVRIPFPDRLKGTPLTLTLSDPKGKRQIVVSEVQW